jgi:hypothetical protein
MGGVSNFHDTYTTHLILATRVFVRQEPDDSEDDDGDDEDGNESDDDDDDNENDEGYSE